MLLFDEIKSVYVGSKAKFRDSSKTEPGVILEEQASADARRR
ncbi:hypothetical protein [Campylobacter curvus]|nr:hypothetical protein [Campylobacter curvus]